MSRQTNDALRDFLQERWKGLLPILWGQQLRQERLDELIYLDLLNADHLPGHGPSPLASYQLRPTRHVQSAQSARRLARSRAGDRRRRPGHRTPEIDLLVIGAGFAGLVAPGRPASRGSRCG